MQKQTKLIFIILFLSLVFLAACDRNPYTPTHTQGDDCIFGEWEITREATTTATGLKTRVCTITPRHVETKVIPMNHMVASFDMNGGRESPEPIFVLFNTQYGSLPSGLTKDGHIFIGWFYGDTQITNSTIVRGHGDHYLIARWHEVKPKTIANAGMGGLTIDTEGNLWGWGTMLVGDDRVEMLNPYYPVIIEGDKKFSFVSSGANHILAIDTQGYLWAMGVNHRGQLGDGTAIYRPYFVRVNHTNRFIFVKASTNRSFAIDIYGNLWGWGLNQGGLGTGGNQHSLDVLSPTRIIPETRFRYVCASTTFAFAIDIYGNLWSWGSGRHGDGTMSIRNMPAQVNSVPIFSSVAMGSNHALALDINNNLWAWGSNLDGQLGDEIIVGEQLIPVQIKEGTTFSSISAVGASSFAIDTDGNLWAWGDNRHGALGDGTTINRRTPVLIGEGTKFAFIAHGRLMNTIAKDIDGQIWAWGWDPFGYLGGLTHYPTRVIFPEGVRF